MNIYQARPAESDVPEYYRNYVKQVSGDTIELILSEAKKETLAFFQVLPTEKWSFRYAPGKWSIKELILHLMDSERVFAYRILRIARGDETPMPGFDQNVFVPNSNADNRSTKSIIEEYQAVREATLQLVKNLTEEMWQRQGTASGVPFSPLVIAFIIAGHEAHHLRIIKERYL